MGYFRPLVMSVLKNEKNAASRIDLLNQIERFIFIVFRLSRNRSNYGDSQFYNASREFNHNELTIEDIKEAAVRRYYYETHDQLTEHIADFVNAYNFAKRLKTLTGLTPFEFISEK